MSELILPEQVKKSIEETKQDNIDKAQAVLIDNLKTMNYKQEQLEGRLIPVYSLVKPMDSRMKEHRKRVIFYGNENKNIKPNQMMVDVYVKWANNTNESYPAYVGNVPGSIEDSEALFRLVDFG